MYGVPQNLQCDELYYACMLRQKINEHDGFANGDRNFFLTFFFLKTDFIAALDRYNHSPYVAKPYTN